MRVALVAAIAENGVIGRDGGMPWRLKSDMRAFRAITMNKPIIMGRKTFESLPGPLAGRDNIVVSRNLRFSADGIIICPDIPEALQVAQSCAARRGADDICVIGGAQIYAACLDVSDRIYLTRVHARPEGDSFFPPFEPDLWRETSRRFVAAGEHDSADMSFIILDKIAAGA